jgi:hypothetical protein
VPINQFNLFSIAELSGCLIIKRAVVHHIVFIATNGIYFLSANVLLPGHGDAILVIKSRIHGVSWTPIFVCNFTIWTILKTARTSASHFAPAITGWI